MPKQREMSAAEVGELRHEYSVTVEPARRKRSEVLASERRLSDLVNQAYGPTDDDVELMWRTAPPRMPFARQGFSAADNDIAVEVEAAD